MRHLLSKSGIFGVEELRRELLVSNGILRSSFCDCHGKLLDPSDLIQDKEAITVRCIENLELWVNHIATANGRKGELYLRGTTKDFGSNYAQFFRKKDETKEESKKRREEMLEKMMERDKALAGLFRSSNDTNEIPLGSRSRITEFSQRLAVLQHYEQIESIGLDATKDPKVAAAFAFSDYADMETQSNRKDDAFIYGIFISGELKIIHRSEPRIRTSDELEEDQFVLMDLGAFLPATAKRPRLQKGHMIYRACDLVALKKLCVPVDDSGSNPNESKRHGYPAGTVDGMSTGEEVEDADGHFKLSGGVKVERTTDSGVSLELHSVGGQDDDDDSTATPSEIPLDHYKQHLLTNGGWDANDFCIVKFRIPKEITYRSFFGCHTEHPMSMNRLLRPDHLKERLENEFDSSSSETKLVSDVSDEPTTPSNPPRTRSPSPKKPRLT